MSFLSFTLCLAIAQAARLGPSQGNDTLQSAGTWLTVAILARHNPTSWKKNACSQAPFGLEKCNLQVYEEAIKLASDQQVDLIVFPEGYSLTGSLSKDSHIEPLKVEVGSTPCLIDSEGILQQRGVSCAARAHEVAVAANFILRVDRGKVRIVEVIFDKQGQVLSIYHKHHLAPIFETRFFDPGPWSPTVFDFSGLRFGILVCYEGFAWSDFMQMEALREQNASVFLWSVGPALAERSMSQFLSQRFQVSVVAAVQNSGGAFVGPGGQELFAMETPLTGLSDIGYLGKTSLRVAQI